MNLKKVIGATLAIDAELDIEKVSKNIKNGLKKIESSTRGLKFDQESLNIVKLDKKSIQLQIKDIQGTVYKFQQDLAKLNAGEPIELINIKTDSIDKTKAKLNSYYKDLAKVEDKINSLDQGGNNTDFNDDIYTKYIKLYDHLDKINKKQITITQTKQNELNKEFETLKNLVSTEEGYQKASEEHLQTINKKSEAYEKLIEKLQLEKRLNEQKQSDSDLKSKEKKQAEYDLLWQKLLHEDKLKAEQTEQEQLKLKQKEIDKLIQKYDNLDSAEKKYQESLYKKFGSTVTNSGVNTSSLSGSGMSRDDIAIINEAIQAQTTLESKLVGIKTAVDSTGNEWVQYTHNIDLANGHTEKLTTSINKNNQEVRQNSSIVVSNVKTSGTSIDKLKVKMKEILTYFSASTIIFAFFNELKKGIKVITDIDREMTGLRKVTDETEASYDKFLTTAGKIGNSIGRTIPEVINATAEFAKLGYELEKSTALAEKALVFTNIGDDMTLDGAIESIVASLKGFNMDAVGENVEENTQKIIDSINEVSNEFAVSTGDLAEGIKRSSATLNQSGVDLDHTLGLLTGAIEVLQDAETASTGLVVLSQRIRGIGEDGEALEGLAPTLEGMFNSKGLTMLTDNGDLKDTFTILQDVNGVWDELSSLEKQYWGEFAPPIQ